jgi:hypothetical protein
MATRTIKLLGQGFGSSPVSITATVDGATVYTGTINTVDEPVPAQYTGKGSDMFSFTVDTTFSGTKPVTIAVTGGTLVTTVTLGNYAMIKNPALTPEEAATFDFDDPDNVPPEVESKGGYFIPGSDSDFGAIGRYDSKNNVTIDGVPQVKGDPTGREQFADWFWTVNSGSTIAFDSNITVPAGTPT